MHRLKQLRGRSAGITSILLVASCAAPASIQPASAEGEWLHHGGDPGSRKYSSLDQINRNNVNDLRIAWRWESPDTAIRAANPALRPPFLHEATPIMTDGVLYTSTSYHLVAAIDAATGQTLWTYDPGVWKRNALRGPDEDPASQAPPNWAFAHRGVAYWSDGRIQRVYMGTGDGRLISLDAKTGRPDPEFGDAGIVDLTQGLSRPLVRGTVGRDNRLAYGVSSPPMVCGDVLVVGSNLVDALIGFDGPPGDVRGYDARTGEQLWRFNTVPQPAEHGADTWPLDALEIHGNANVWTLMSYDPELNYVYLPVSGTTNDYYGGHRPGDNLFSQSLVAVDVATGRRVWHYQLTHHGLWDYDPPAAPVLAHIEVNGRQIKAVAQVTKQGFTFVFDRETGEPVWPIEERGVPTAPTVEGEMLSPTQPFPTVPEAFERQGVTPGNLIDFTPELRQEALTILQQHNHGPLYSPPSLEGTLIMPGRIGGANWGGAAFDPETGILYVPSLSKVDIYRLGTAASSTDFRLVREEYAWGSGPQGLPLTKPPYGRLTAIGLNEQGRHLWMVPVGEGPRHHPTLQPLELPDLGSPRFRFPLVTENGLLFLSEGRAPGRESAWWEYGSEASTGELEETRLRALDKDNGTVLWEFELPGPASAQPMTYMQDGRQHLVIAVGGMGVWKQELIAFALP